MPTDLSKTPTPEPPSLEGAPGSAVADAGRAALVGLAPEPGVAKPDPILVATNITRQFGGLKAVDVEHLEIQRGVITALIGPNGAGKTTFFNLLTGFDQADTGDRTFRSSPRERAAVDLTAPLEDIPFARWAQRVAATFYDVVIPYVVALGLMVLGVTWNEHNTLTPVAIFLTIAAPLGLLAFFVYNVVWRQGRTGQTIGKQILSIRVVREDGRPMTPGLSFGRQVVHVVDGLSLCIGYLWPIWDDRRQTFADKILHTVVIDDAYLPFAPVSADSAGARVETPLRRVSASRIANLGMVRTFQLTKVLSKLTVMENMRLGATGQRGEKFWVSPFGFMWSAQETANSTRAMDLLARFKLDTKADDFAGSLSGGQRKLLEMARSLMVNPELVMLDEPMAGVNPALKQSLLQHVKSLREEGMTVLFVEHDMDMVRDISDWVVVMAQGQVIAEGPPDSVMGDQRVIDAYLGAHHDTDITELDLEAVAAEAEAELFQGEKDK